MERWWRCLWQERPTGVQTGLSHLIEREAAHCWPEGRKQPAGALCFIHIVLHFSLTLNATTQGICFLIRPIPHHSLMLHELQVYIWSSQFFRKKKKNERTKISKGIVILIFRQIGNFKNQKPSESRFISKWMKTVLKQRDCWKNMTSLWLRLEIRSPYGVCKIRLQNLPAPSSLVWMGDTCYLTGSWRWDLGLFVSQGKSNSV